MNGQIFSSNFNSTDRGSIVKALFALTDQSLQSSFFYLDVYFYLLVKVRAIILYVSSPNRIINMWYDIVYIVALCILI